MNKRNSLFDEDEKYPVKGLAYGFYFCLLKMDLLFCFHLVQEERQDIGLASYF
jgi:hypothetical protein